MSFCLHQLHFGSSDILWNMKEKRVSEVSLEIKGINKLNIEDDNPRALRVHLILVLKFERNFRYPIISMPFCEINLESHQEVISFCEFRFYQNYIL